MKRMIFACVLAATVALPSFAHAEDGVWSGHITVGNPVTAEVGGVTEEVSLCDPADPTQGIDGWWIVLGPDDAGRDGSVTATGATGLEDPDVYFYDASCSLMSGGSWANNVAEATETGVIPDGAAFAIVDLFVGAQADFTLTLN